MLYAQKRRALRITQTQAALALHRSLPVLRSSTKRDEAQFVQQSFQEARGKGPDAINRLIRCVLKNGRKYKAPMPSPCLLDSNGCQVSDRAQTLRMLGDHFGSAEHSRCTTLDQIRAASQALPHEGIDVHDLPSLSDVAAAFARLAPLKAPGLAGIPGELYSSAPLHAAQAHLPLILKIAARNQTPLLWKGGHAVAIVKPGKNPSSLAGWRSIMLMESASKAWSQALRAPIAKALEAWLPSCTGGALKRRPVELPMQAVQAHVALLKREGSSGAVLFVDGKSPFYATMRELIARHDPHGSAPTAAVDELISRLHVSPAVKTRARLLLSQPAALVQMGVPAALHDILHSSTQNTWFCMDPSNAEIHATKSGTMPGAPLADALFQVAFGLFLRDLHDSLEEEGLYPAGANKDGHASDGYHTPSWMDDVAILLTASSASAVVPQLLLAAKHVFIHLASIGITTNFERGKRGIAYLARGRCQV